jgi:hypothetical protein
MVYLAALGLAVLIGLLAFLRVAKLVFAPREMYTKPRPGGRGQITYCRHCDVVITEHNFGEHGVNCA